MNMAALYDSIGPAGCVLVVVGCVGVYIALRTLFYMLFVWRHFRKDFLEVQSQGESCLRHLDSANPLIVIVREIVSTHASHSDDIRAEVSYLFNRNFESVSKSLCWLKLISVISPLLGLLGTVLGMVGVFQTISQNAAPDAAMLAAGIWEALITTVMGLCVAIPILMFYYFLLLKFKSFHIEAVEHSYRALELCQGPEARAARERRKMRHE
ncbi:MotA/TolQ/ExbB proton channel family protein [uncultured Desulfovibrio sp.]|uniref:MotA/TolQ/ExbB proton channel family protein n=2 Tax=uncultured Desulfovibrio sp. TaxID=167968 RepID=UPI00261C84C5|nr:MotA/TolQ/ExbB proton channel family protein [uncultured Desulfovibrio sp.]